MDGERQIRLILGDKITIHFDRQTTIQFVDKDGYTILQIDPTELSAIYHAYRGMEKEHIEDNNFKK